MFTRKLQRAGAAVVAALALGAVPAVAHADAVQVVESWTDVPIGPFFSSENCLGKTIAGFGTGSGGARITLTSNGALQIRDFAHDTWQLYEATGNPEIGVVLGAFFATWTVDAHGGEHVAPNGQGSLGSVAHGWLTYPDGTRQFFQIVFRLVLQPDGPPKVFLVKFVCGA
jgi:hypothetical protein